MQCSMWGLTYTVYSMLKLAGVRVPKVILSNFKADIGLFAALVQWNAGLRELPTDMPKSLSIFVSSSSRALPSAWIMWYLVLKLRDPQCIPRPPVSSIPLKPPVNSFDMISSLQSRVDGQKCTHFLKWLIICLLTILSRILHTWLVRLIGLQLFGSAFLPFLNIGVIVACFHCMGSSPHSNEFLNSPVSGLYRTPPGPYWDCFKRCLIIIYYNYYIIIKHRYITLSFVPQCRVCPYTSWNVSNK